MDALSLLMEAVRSEAETLQRLAAIYREGGGHWGAVKDAIDREYEKLGGRVGPPSAEPAP